MRQKELWEFRHDPSAAVRAITDVPPVPAEFIALHTKLIVSDRQRCFVGSLNLDRRALEINTENGLYIDSADFCGVLAEHVDWLMEDENAWHVTIDEDSRVKWESDGVVQNTQPARSLWQRLADRFLRWLPIESQLKAALKKQTADRLPAHFRSCH